jgi:tungstate transport system substrate-binding protein
VLVGPPEDTAGIRDMVSPGEAFKRLADERRPYVLRVDGSGTASRQNALLVSAGVEEAGEWLLTTQGDAEEALQVASREGAYTLAARSDFERLANEVELEILMEKDELLANPYRVAKVSALVYPDTDIAGARELIDYLLSEDARRFFDLGAWVPPEE